MIKPDWHLIESENANLSIQKVEKIGEGWNCLGYLVNGVQVFKISKFDCWDELGLEFMFLEMLGQQLSLPVPCPLFYRQISKAVPFGYAVYSYIPGGGLTLGSLSSQQRQAVICDIAYFLKTLHRLDPGLALRQMLHIEDHNYFLDTAKRLLRAAETEIVQSLSTQEIHVLQREFTQHIKQYQQSVFEPCLLHRDFCTDHIRMANGVISGVIDFGNLVLGDPDTEFSEIYLEHGEAFLLEIARAYGHKYPYQLLEKMARLSIVNQVEVIIDDAESAPEGEVENSWLILQRLLQQRM
jgi:aminoglycoside 2''-phosphotransferase